MLANSAMLSLTFSSSRIFSCSFSVLRSTKFTCSCKMVTSFLETVLAIISYENFLRFVTKSSAVRLAVF